VISDYAEHTPGATLIGPHWIKSSVPCALEAIATLVAERFGEDVYLISKAGPRMESRTRVWLEQVQFSEATGILPENVIYVRRREDKAPECERLGVTHFVDDRVSVLQHLTTI